MNRVVIIAAGFAILLFGVSVYGFTYLKCENDDWQRELSVVYTKELDDYHQLMHVIRSGSKKKYTYFNEFEKEQHNHTKFLFLLDHPELSEVPIEKSFMTSIFPKIDSIVHNFSPQVSKYYLLKKFYSRADHFYEKYEDEYDINLFCTVENKRDTYMLGEKYDLNLMLYEKVDQTLSHYYRSNGNHYKIDSFPLVLEKIPEDLEFQTLVKNAYTGEMIRFSKAYKSGF